MATKPPAPSDIADKFMLRLPDGMRERLAEAAKANNRSMNAEIIFRLDASFSSELNVALKLPTEEEIAAIAQRYRAFAREVLGLPDDETPAAPKPARKPRGKATKKS
jgi:hypothetical protein